MNHSELVNELLIALSEKGCIVVKFSTGEGTTDYGGRIKFGSPGWADIIGATPCGRFLAVEAKTGKARLGPKQRAFRDAVIKRGGVHITARSLANIAIVQTNEAA